MCVVSTHHFESKVFPFCSVPIIVVVRAFLLGLCSLGGKTFSLALPFMMQIFPFSPDFSERIEFLYVCKNAIVEGKIKFSFFYSFSHINSIHFSLLSFSLRSYSLKLQKEKNYWVREENHCEINYRCEWFVHIALKD